MTLRLETGFRFGGATFLGSGNGCEVSNLPSQTLHGLCGANPMPRDRLSFLLDLSPSTTNQTPRKSVSYSRMAMNPNHLRPLETVSVERAFAWAFAHLWAFDRKDLPSHDPPAVRSWRTTSAACRRVLRSPPHVLSRRKGKCKHRDPRCRRSPSCAGHMYRLGRNTDAGAARPRRRHAVALPKITLSRRHRQTFLSISETRLELECPSETVAGPRAIS